MLFTSLNNRRQTLTEEPETEISLQQVSTWNQHEIADLYRAGGWWQEEWDEGALLSLIESSYAFVVAHDTTSGKTVGMGRVISDGVSDAYLQDVVVFPAYRNRGIGQMIIKKLVRICHNSGIEWIGLVAQPGTVSLYQRCGFQVMEGHTAMKYGKNEMVP